MILSKIINIKKDRFFKDLSFYLLKLIKLCTTNDSSAPTNYDLSINQITIFMSKKLVSL